MIMTIVRPCTIVLPNDPSLHFNVMILHPLLQQFKECIEYAQSKGIEPLEHLLLPRTKGFSLTLDALRGHLDAVYDTTIAYVGGVPSLWQWCRGDVSEVGLYVRRFEISSLPTTDEELAAWLQARWREKDVLLDHYYTHGVWPSSESDA